MKFASLHCGPCLIDFGLKSDPFFLSNAFLLNRQSQAKFFKVGAGAVHTALQRVQL